MEPGALGRVYEDRAVIVRQGDVGDNMYVIQEGRVEITTLHGGIETRLYVLEAGDFFGEMAIFERQVRSATARALGEARVLTVDQRNILRRVHEDPSLAFRIMRVMSSRIRHLNEEVARLEDLIQRLSKDLIEITVSGQNPEQL